MKMSEKKRKRPEKVAETARKKLATTSSPAANQPQAPQITVTHHETPRQWGPMLASTPGFSLPPNTEFKPFHHQSEILIHSTSHARLSYNARDSSTPTKPQDGLSHYIAVFNPASAALDLVPARHLTLRSTLKAEDDEVQRDAAKQAFATGVKARQKLGLEFGTKKAKKAIESLAQNAIAPAGVERHLGADLEGRKEARELLQQDQAASAVLDGITAVSAGVQKQAERDAAAAGAQPRPQPNMEAKMAQEVYPTSLLVGTSTLNSITVKDWIDAINAGEAIETTSRFVAQHVESVADEDDTSRLKVLRYMLMLIEFNNLLRPGGKEMYKKLPKAELVKEKLLPLGPESVIESVKKRFSKRGDVTKWMFHHMLSHLAAMSLFVTDMECEISALAEDLKMTATSFTLFYRMIGARVGAPTESQRQQLKLTAGDARSVKFARLKLPLDFPKQRRLPVKNRG